MAKLKPGGKPPAIALVNPKFPHNVGAALRAASCFGMRQVWFTGKRVSLEPSKGYRLPREERMKGYRDVELLQCDYFFERFKPGAVVPVAVEVRENSESLVLFEHPENALYVFGPEDGGLSKVHLRHCHRFVVIPTAHCLNLAAAVNVILYDRRAKRQRAGQEPMDFSGCSHEVRGFAEAEPEKGLVFPASEG
jgi:tRNA(Leu) C34 or U34 (ribose-2'-O)-methylase TrmL